MQCQACGTSPAEVQIREIRGEEVNTLYLCNACAENYDLGTSSCPSLDEPEVTIRLSAASQQSESPSAQTMPPDDLIDDLQQTEDSEDARIEMYECPNCGWTEQTLSEKKRLGCPECYNTFWELLAPIIHDWHNEVAHKGELPKEQEGERKPAPPPGSGHLERELDVAIACEDYERAAELRDQLCEQENTYKCTDQRT